MNFNLSHLPFRSEKPRQNGLNMVMDKGLSIQEAENLVSSAAEYVDLLKFGFGTSVVSSGIKEKFEIYRSANIKPYFGGTLFELFLVRNQLDDFKKLIDEYKLDLIEISDGSIALPHNEKLKYIEEFSKITTVMSEVGSKIAGVNISRQKWVDMMKAELAAGSWKVIAEAREAGNIGIYNNDGSANKDLIGDIMKEIDNDSILWEAPNKPQQVYFIKLMGTNVNLGNIAPNEVIPLETIRMGLRGDTFFDFLPIEIANKYKVI